MPAASASRQLYIRLDGGYRGYDEPNITEDGIYDLADDDIGGAGSIGGGIGRYFTDTLRGDITYDHHFEADVSAACSTAQQPFLAPDSSASKAMW